MELKQHGTLNVPDAVYRVPWGGGVDIFFVISGFIIYHIGGAQPAGVRSAIDFMIRRVIRIAPTYWLFTFAMLGVMMTMSDALRQNAVSLGNVAMSLFFYPYSPDNTVAMRPILAQGWTLNFEMFFYLVFAVLVCVAPPQRRFAALIGSLAALVAVGAVFPIQPPLFFLLQPLLLLFAAGIAIARYYDRLPRHGTPVTATLVVAAAVLATAFGEVAETDLWVRLLTRGVPAFAIVYAVLFWRRPPAWVAGGPVPLLGDASYALYLSHPFVVNAMLLIFAKIGLKIGVFYLIATVAASVLAGLVIFLVIERPTTSWLTRAYRRSFFNLLARKRAEPVSQQAGW